MATRTFPQHVFRRRLLQRLPSSSPTTTAVSPLPPPPQPQPPRIRHLSTVSLPRRLLQSSNTVSSLSSGGVRRRALHGTPTVPATADAATAKSTAAKRKPTTTTTRGRSAPLRGKKKPAKKKTGATTEASADATADASTATTDAVVTTPPKRKRGRPPKKAKTEVDTKVTKEPVNVSTTATGEISATDTVKATTTTKATTRPTRRKKKAAVDKEAVSSSLADETTTPSPESTTSPTHDDEARKKEAAVDREAVSSSLAEETTTSPPKSTTSPTHDDEEQFSNDTTPTEWPRFQLGGRDNPLFLNSPLWELNKLYSQKGIKAVSKSSIHSQQFTLDDDSLYWTASLECPATEQTFHAGRLRGEEYVVHHRHVVDDDGDRRKETIPLYKRKIVAQQAAAARALDWFRFDDQNQLEPRLCEEDPLAGLSTVSASNDAENAHVVQDGFYEPEYYSGEEAAAAAGATVVVESEEDDGDSDGDSDTGESAVANGSGSAEPAKVSSRKHPLAQFMEGIIEHVDDEGEEEDEDEEENDEEDDGMMTVGSVEYEDEGSTKESRSPSSMPKSEEKYVVVNAPWRSYQTPAKALLQSLSERPTSFRSQQRSQRHVVPDPVGEAQRTAETVRQWTERERRLRNGDTDGHAVSQRLILQPPSEDTLLIRAKSMLSRLAQAVDEVPLGSPIVGPQSAARDVLQLLTETTVAQPDADFYAIYLKCLDGPDGHVIDSKADAIVQDMKKGRRTQGHKPPPPNANVYNALIRLNIQTGRAGENTAWYNTFLKEFSRTADTYWALLSNEAYRWGNNDSLSFDTDFCQECISNIRDLTDTIVDDVLLLNTPLRWSGGRKAFCRRIPWPIYEKHFAKGFRKYDEEQFKVQRAKAMQEWVESNPCLPSVQPNIESYEAVIQAWLRTATRKGMGHAEDIVDKLLQQPTDSPSYPRFETFHPILFAWMYSDAPESGNKLKEWTDRILAAARESDKIVPDARLYEVALYARVSMLKAQRNGGQTLTLDECLELANECTVLLEQFSAAAYQSHSAPDGSIFTSLWRPFVFAMDAWQNFGRIAAANRLSKGTTDETRHPLHPDKDHDLLSRTVLTQWRRIRTDFESLVSAIAEIDIPAEPRRREYGRLTGEMQEIVENSHRIYFMYVSMLVRIIETEKPGNLSPAECSSLMVDMEGCVRKMGEFNQLATLHHWWKESTRPGADPEATAPIKRVYADHFDYGFDTMFANEMRIGRTALPWKVMSTVGQLYERHGTHVSMGELARTCTLLKHISRDWKFKTSQFEEEVNSILEESVPAHRAGRTDSVRRVTTSSNGNDGGAKEEEDAQDASAAARRKSRAREKFLERDARRRPSKTRKGSPKSGGSRSKNHRSDGGDGGKKEEEDDPDAARASRKRHAKRRPSQTGKGPPKSSSRSKN